MSAKCAARSSLCKFLRVSRTFAVTLAGETNRSCPARLSLALPSFLPSVEPLSRIGFREIDETVNRCVETRTTASALPLCRAIERTREGRDAENEEIPPGIPVASPRASRCLEIGPYPSPTFCLPGPLIERDFSDPACVRARVQRIR